MCGIVGILALSKSAPLDPLAIRKMGDTIIHRGPDDEGYFVTPNVALGNRRLSIIDLGGGQQPITTPDGRYTIVYNGEVFNYKPLKAELSAAGYPFQTQSDTEVVLAGYSIHGAAFLDRLEGMFAFLIYDAQTGELLGARDPFGIKPLYLFGDKDAVYVASEIKAIKSIFPYRRELNLDALSSFLSCGYSVGEQTLFGGIWRVRPGCLMRWSPDGSYAEHLFARRLLPESFGTERPSDKDVERELIMACDRSLVADVPVGLYLSGGIDSSLIASIVTRELGQKLQSFSVRFSEDKEYDEGPIASRVARELGLDHEAIDVTAKDFLDLNQLARTLEEPMADPSAVALGKLSSLVAKRLKVVLSGEGGDELFGGYHRYFWYQLLSSYQKLPPLMRSSAEQLALLLGSERVRRRVGKLRSSGELPMALRYRSWFGSFQPDELQALCENHSGNLDATNRIFEREFESGATLPPGAQAQWVDVMTFLRDDLLSKADKMSMANSVEVRVPFLQVGVAVKGFQLAQTQQPRFRETKPFLRKMLNKYLPRAVTERKKKGFEVPLDRWFRGPLMPLLDKYLSEQVIRSRSLLNWETVQKIRQEHQSGKGNRGLALFSLCLLEAWCQEYLS